MNTRRAGFRFECNERTSREAPLLRQGYDGLCLVVYWVRGASRTRGRKTQQKEVGGWGEGVGEAAEKSGIEGEPFGKY